MDRTILFFDVDGVPSFSTLLAGVGKRISNVDMLTDLLGTHYWAIPELVTTAGVSQRIGNLESLLTDFLGAYYWAIPVSNATVASLVFLGVC